MVFSSPTFIFLFFPAVFLTCLLTRRSVKWSNAVLLIFSLLFYAWGEPVYVLLMAFTTLVCYICARMIAKGKNVRLSTAVAVIWGIGTLVVFKYTAFLVQSFNSLTHLAVPVPQIALPVGISFFTFQAISYVLDVKRGDAEAAASYADVLLYISLFPQLIAGPIVRYSDVAAEIKQRTVTTEDIAAGLRRFCFGMGKKVLIANTLAYTADKVFALDSAAINAPIAWLGAVCYLMQIYFDFSGYSDMAIGLGRAFGFTFRENFMYPYCAASMQDFWRRWHISLSTWFKEYVYIPLGGNRRGKLRTGLNKLIVFLLTGLWHGAAWNFVLWGLFFAVFLTVEKLWYGRALAKTRVFKHIYVLLLVVVSFVLFDANSVGEAAAAIGGLFGAAGVSAVNPISLYYLRSFAVVFLIGIVGATPLPKRIVEQLGSTRAGAMVVDVLEPLVLVSVLAVSTGYLVDGSFNPFLYFRF